MEAQSTLESLLISNDPPPDAEILVIRNIIADEQSRLLDLDTHIAALKKILEPLVDERNATADRILRHQSVISAARRVPPEILGEIFLLTLPSQEDGMLEKASCVDSSPWLVGRICSRWREIALALPELWTTILIYDCGDAHPSLLLRRVKMLLHRSANQLLHIYLAPPSYRFIISPEVLEVLADSSPRWETVQSASNWFYPGGPMDRIKGRLDRLKSLSFFDSPPYGELFTDAPQLRRLESNEVFASDFPWTQLTYLNIDVGTRPLNKFTLILPHLVNVVECHIQGWAEEDDTVTITLPALQKLYLDEMPLPPSLIAPGLTHITLGLDFLNALPHVVSRSGCDLQSVMFLPPLGFDIPFSFSALSHCPTICDLNIHSEAGDFNTLCTTLTVQHDSPIALPKLKDLTFFFTNYDLALALGFAQLNLETLVSMLKSRWNVDGCARICHVHLKAQWHIEPPFIEGLLSRLVGFDDEELSLWLTDINPIEPTNFTDIPIQVSRRLRWS